MEITFSDKLKVEIEEKLKEILIATNSVLEKCDGRKLISLPVLEKRREKMICQLDLSHQKINSGIFGFLQKDNNFSISHGEGEVSKKFPGFWEVNNFRVMISNAVTDQDQKKFLDLGKLGKIQILKVSSDTVIFFISDDPIFYSFIGIEKEEKQERVIELTVDFLINESILLVLSIYMEWIDLKQSAKLAHFPNFFLDQLIKEIWGEDPFENDFFK